MCVDWHPCMAHRLHTFVTNAFTKVPEIYGLLRKFRTIYKTFLFKKAELDKAAMQDFGKMIESLDEHLECSFENCDGQEDNEEATIEQPAWKKAKKIKLDVSTRWNSTYLMLKSIKDQMNTIHLALLNIGKIDQSFTKNDISLLNNLITFLEPFYTTTNLVSQARQITIVRGCHEIIKLKNMVKNSLIGQSHPIAHKFLQQVNSNMDKTLALSDDMVVAILLDPIVKDNPIVQQFIKSESIDPLRLIRVYLAKFGIDNQDVENNVLDINDSWRCQEVVPISSVSLSDQISNYLSKKHKQEPLIQFWRNNPGPLAELAKIVFSMPISSVSPERTFSAANLTISSLRSNLNGNIVRMLMFLNRNYQLCKDALSKIDTFERELDKEIAQVEAEEEGV